jgi:L-tyrosine C(3)-methyltransferase
MKIARELGGEGAQMKAQQIAAPLSAPTSRCQNELDYDGFIGIFCGHSAFQLLAAAAELKLFALLAERGTATGEEIAHELHLAAQPARILLNGLTATRLLEKTSDGYRNSAMSDRHLVPGRAQCYLPMLGWQRDIVYPGLRDFTRSLRENRNVGLRNFPGHGATLYERLAENPALERIFHEAMSGLSSQANAELAAAIDLSSVRHLVDLGGGDGTNAINLAQRFPHLHATVFDGSTVLDNAQSKIAAAGLEARISTMPGDFFLDELPAQADAMLLAHIVTIWSGERNTDLLKKCRARLPSGGKVFIFNMVSYDDESGPLVNALGSPYFHAIATGEGMLYCGKDIEAWLREAGFSHVSRMALPMEHALFTGVK